MKQLNEIEKRQIAIGASVEHIRGRIDNGLANTVEEMRSCLMKVVPIIDSHAVLKTRIEDFFWASVKALIWGLVIAALSLMVWGLSHGWKP